MVNSMGSQAGVVVTNHPSHENVVCELTFSESQANVEAFLQVLQFPPSKPTHASMSYNLEGHKFISRCLLCATLSK